MAAIDIISTLAGWFTSAWNTITGIPGDLGNAFSKMWHLVQDQHSVVSWLVGYPIWHAVYQTWKQLNLITVIEDISRQLHQRAPGWTWLEQIQPQVTRLDGRITQLRAWAVSQFHTVYVVMGILYQASLAYTRKLVGIERAQRIQAIQAEHAAMLKAVAACLATVQAQAASGYNAGLHDRLSTVGKLLNEIADRSPAVRDLVNLLIKAVFDLEVIDNPLLRWTIGHLLSSVIGHLGIDQATGDFISSLLAPFTGGGQPHDLASVEKDVADRLNTLEDQWAGFMTSGGPEVEQAGKQWKDITSLAVDAGILAMFALAVADPAAWATAVADTVGEVENATLTAVVDLIGAV